VPRAFHLVGLLLLWPLAAIAGEPSAPAEGADVLPLQPVEELKLPLEPAAPPELLPAPQPPAEEPAPPVKPMLRTVKGYYVGYADDSFEAVRRYASALDIVAGQWLAVDRAGQIKEAPDFARNDEVRRIVHAAGRKVYTCVINKDFDRGVLTSILSSAARRSATIDRIIAFVEKKGDDGIDLDFEGVRAGHQAGYTAFVKELSEKLHARGKELSIALDVTWGGAPSPGLDYRVLAQYADSIMPMTYTYGPGRVPHSPISYLEQAAKLGVRSMAPEKFMIGIGVYGRDYNLRTGQRTHPNAQKLQAILANHSPKVTLNEKTLTKTLSYQDASGHAHLMHFDDPETIRAKLTRLAERYQVSAVGFWRLGQEDPAMWDFIQVASGRKRPNETASYSIRSAW
jgi:spore germination protein